MSSTMKTQTTPRANIVEYLPIVDARPIRRPQYRTPYALKEEMQTQVQNMFDKGVMRESKCPW
jgi:hypothetical protein